MAIYKVCNQASFLDELLKLVLKNGPVTNISKCEPPSRTET